MMFERIYKKIIDAVGSELREGIVLLSRQLEQVEERLAAKISATDPKHYWCGVVFVGKTTKGEPVVLSAGQWLDDQIGRVMLPLVPMIELEAGGFVFVQGPCLIMDVYVGNVSQLGGYSGNGMPLCYVQDKIPLGSQLNVRIERLKYPGRRGY